MGAMGWRSASSVVSGELLRVASTGLGARRRVWISDRAFAFERFLDSGSAVEAWLVPNVIFKVEPMNIHAHP